MSAALVSLLSVDSVLHAGCVGNGATFVNGLPHVRDGNLAGIGAATHGAGAGR